MADQPQIYSTKTTDLVQSIQAELTDTGWATQPDGAGTALTHLFGRLVQIIAHRLNQTPRQHFRAFLNEAGIDRAVPRAARTELTFTPAPDASAPIQVPARTQVATRPTPTQPEIIFETDEDLTVITAQLAHCFALDRVKYSDRSAIARGDVSGVFAAFRGDDERERVLLIGDDKLFTFDDDNSRRYAIFTLSFTLAQPGDPVADGWRVHWRYWNGAAWTDLSGRVADGTLDLRQNGDVVISALPDDAEPFISPEGAPVWLAARLSGGEARAHLPVVQRIAIRRAIRIENEVTARIDAAVTATQSGTVLGGLDVNASCMPLGAYPVALDAFYLRLDEALTKPGAQVTLDLTLDEIAADLAPLDDADAPRIAWEYFSANGWIRLGESRRGCPELAKRNLQDLGASFDKPKLVTQPFSRRKLVEIKLLKDVNTQDLPESLAGGKVITDIYDQRRYVQIPVPDACAHLPEQDLIHGAYDGVEGFDFRDGTCALTCPGIVRFTLPPPKGKKNPSTTGEDTPLAKAEDKSPAPTEIGGQRGYWLRARLLGGGYTVPQSTSTGLLSGLRNLAANPYVPPLTAPPVLQQITVRYGHFEIAAPPATDPPQTVTRCYSQVDRRRRTHEMELRDGKFFTPFTAATEAETLFLGFSPLDGHSGAPALPPGQWIQLRVNIPGAYIATLRQARIDWSYWDGGRWRPLAVVDGTSAFQRTGVVGFFAPEHHRPSSEFGEPAYWLRAQPATPSHQPRLETLRLNSVSATNAQTVEKEIIGSGDGEPNQVFRLARAPLLPDDVEIEVFEPDQRRERTEDDAGSGFADAVTAEETRSGGEWMPWTPVTSFYAAGPEDRVFVLDCISGQIHFGDGKRGKIPPPGAENVRARRYRVHNADTGNLAENVITVLRNPGVALSAVRSVANLAAAAGGSAVEEVEQVEARGPYRIKNRGRAVTTEDYVWLARDVEGVERAHCLPTYNVRGETQPGWVTVVVTPQTRHARAEDAERRPVPTAALLQQVQQRLQSQALTNLKDRMPDTTQTAPKNAASTEDRTRIGQIPADSSTDNRLKSAQSVKSAFYPDPISDNQSTSIDEDRILVRAASYLEVTVHAAVTPRRLEQADQVRRDVLAQLEAFLHPTHGGPEGDGWQSGRDVYVSEVAAEIEAVDGVDHAQRIDLSCTSQQRQILHVAGEPLKWPLPAGSQVSSVDEQIKLVLSEGLAEDEPVTRLAVYGFNQGDEIEVVTAAVDGDAQAGEARSVAQALSSGIFLRFETPFEFADREAFEQWRAADPAIRSADRQVRLPLHPALLGENRDGVVHLSA
ncbi:MAG: baseplate J/gp47 family protein [Caldilineaceae bacterium]